MAAVAEIGKAMLSAIQSAGNKPRGSDYLPPFIWKDFKWGGGPVLRDDWYRSRSGS